MSKATFDIPVSNLPSKGHGYKFNTLSISQMVFTEIMDYQTEIESCNNELSSLLTQLKYIVMTLPNGKDISMYDAIPVIAIRVYNSISEKLNDYIKIKYLCPVHKKQELMEVKLDTMEFNDMPQAARDLEEVKIGEHKYRFRIPTVKEFVNVAEYYKLRVPKNNALRYIYIISTLADALDPKVNSQILYDVLNATSKDIVILDQLYRFVSGAFTNFKATCKHGGEPVVVRINTISPITDIFQNILQTEKLDTSAFKFRKTH